MLANQIKPAVKAAELGEGIGWHTFRQTCPCMLRQLGVVVKVQQALLRHADISTTLNVYTQAVSEQKRSAHSSVVASGENRKRNQDNWTFRDMQRGVTLVCSEVYWSGR
jgi:site-specific recombinase XerD